MKLTCDDCGSVQAETNSVCELCGGSLSEERGRAQTASVAKLIGAALVVTALFFVAPGLFLEWYFSDGVSPSTFWLAYIGAWVVGGVLVHFYMPKDSYDFGWQHGAYIVDNPFSLRDNADRAHAKLGMILFPIGIVTGLWFAVFRALFSNR